MNKVSAFLLAIGLPIIGWASDHTNYIRLFSFGGTNGANPQAELIEATDGRLYGMTLEGGLTNQAFPNGMGVIFSLNRDGTDYKVLHYFGCNPLDGKTPHGGLIEGRKGRFYGTTRNGGAAGKGTVFQFDVKSGGIRIMRSFTGEPNDGAYPLAGLLKASDNVLYGTTSNPNTVFRIKQNGKGYEVISDLGTEYGGVDSPAAALVESRDGVLFGSSTRGWKRLGEGWSENTYGAIFSLAKDGGDLSVFHAGFGVNASPGLANPSGMLMASDGYLYGTAITRSSGSIFRVSKGASWDSPFVYHFEDFRAWSCSALIERRNGALYGSAFGQQFVFESPSSTNFEIIMGNVFRLNKDATGFIILKTFLHSNGEGGPQGKLLLGSDDVLYGVSGGNGYGAIFALYSEPCSSVRGLRTNQNRTLTMEARGAAHVKFRLQSATNPLQTLWTDVDTNVASATGALTFTNLPIIEAHQFYRLVSP